MSFLNPFTRPARGGAAWFPAGRASSYPDTDSTTRVAAQRACASGGVAQGCRIFYVPREDAMAARQVAIDEWKEDEGDARDQVMVFRYKGKWVAVNHECPHSSYPLSNGTPFDIEDFGVTLSSGITCPRHDWSFDLHTGRADRGSYKLSIWEVQLRPSEVAGEEEVWVRRKQKIG